MASVWFLIGGLRKIIKKSHRMDTNEEENLHKGCGDAKRKEEQTGAKKANLTLLVVSCKNVTTLRENSACHPGVIKFYDKLLIG
jgi:hypothetical protein